MGASLIANDSYSVWPTV